MVDKFGSRWRLLCVLVSMITGIIVFSSLPKVEVVSSESSWVSGLAD